MAELIDELLDDAEERMGKSVEACRHELATVRTGRASPHLLDRVQVDYYGAETPLKQLAQIHATDARLLTLTPYDKSSIKSIEKSILESDLGLTPSNDGKMIRVPIPPLSEERRKELIKVCKKHGEDTKVSMRNIRRDGNDELKQRHKDGKLSEDELRKAETEIQKLTDQYVQKVDQIIKKKEEEILEV